MAKKIAMVREVVGVFNDYDTMEDAIFGLETSGFGRHQISVLGAEEQVKARFGESNVDAQLLEDNPDVPRSHGIKREEMVLGQSVIISIGLVLGLTAATVAAGGFTAAGIAIYLTIGGLIGMLFGMAAAKILGERYDEFFQNQIEHGGLVLWISTPNTKQEQKAKRLLKQHGAGDIHAHVVPANANRKKIKDRIKLHIFGAIFAKLDRVMRSHKRLLKQDKMLAKKLNQIEDFLQKAENNGTKATKAQISKVANRIKDVALYTQDMGEEEQRAIAESISANTDESSNEAEAYLIFAHDLNCVEQFVRRQG